MKQSDSTIAFTNNPVDWLSSFDQAGLLAALLNACEDTALYVVDKDQKVMHWSRGMSTLTGIMSADVMGMACLPALQIEVSGETTIHLPPISNNPALELKKVTRLLNDNKGYFAGGMGYLSRSGGKADTLPLASKAQHAATKQNFHGLLSRSPAMKDVFHIIQNAAETEATVLVRGESGSGKELVANAIHTLSARHAAPFLAVNCAALSSNLLESELFGHVRGAFTGAIKDHSGLFQRANGGTLFLDEVAEMPLDLQAKLLRVLQERSYIPVGGNRTIDVDVRIVAATHRSLREEVKLGHFREDLMYRLRVVPIFLPPLRERREDISLLIWHFIGLHNDPRVRVIEKIDPDAMKILLDYRWPGNVRELHNIVEYAFAVGRGATLRLAELPPEFREPRSVDWLKPGYSAKPKLTEAEEITAIKRALEQSQGRAGIAAQLAGMSRATFWRKRKHYGV
jgi:transcriptional regulator with PAS, ATPase and Fis domain